MVKDILLLGDDALYQKSEEVLLNSDVRNIVIDLHDTLMEFKRKYKKGRAIAAPQIYIHKRIIYMYIDKPIVFINPTLEFIGSEKMDVLDDCMSFPNLNVMVQRYKKCKVCYYDEQWQKQEIVFEGDLSELIQHEYDHLDGILATMRAIDYQSFYMTK
ncbi:peptide deformylase [Breznakia sp. PF5-3]|uniref:peptide deformylase n=1 Tax=unclassified Breznakia TaxID=2623764 RepID=UPI0024068BD2|nr:MULTISPECIES: peptide deformylase [unclassified Breznakia]MDF9825592.1 peptide deformylase [Breznakia sp. PM6-1]MDF9836417.1 peptide deformylase [Breznakia sp. PF5-3]MDF9838575.1 peptide deformylase [Breznakia sp. PFB2-8]MDF9860578.1 peptide deformylase [Breznakia sp. PH5-24]